MKTATDKARTGTPSKDPDPPDWADLLDLRPRRDLLSRRFSSNVQRRVMRVLALLGLDTVAVTAALALAGHFSAPQPAGLVGLSDRLPWVGVLVLLGQIAAGAYGPVRRIRVLERITVGLLFSGVAIAAVSVSGADGLKPEHLLLFLLLLGPMFGSTRLVFAAVVRALYRRGIGVKNAVIVGSGPEAWDLIRRFRAGRQHDIRIVGHVAMGDDHDPTGIGTADQLPAILEKFDIRNVIVSSHLEPTRFRELVTECFAHGAGVSVVPATLAEIPARVGSKDVLGWPILEMAVPRLHLVQLLVKRTLDITASFLGLVLLSPVLLGIAVAIRVNSGRPVLFTQRRLGVGGREFTIFKFRSMRPDAESLLRRDQQLYQTYLDNDYKLPPGEDPRISTLGAFLRRTSLDELPQLFNVLKGDMSLVGPRPIVPEEISEYGEHARTFLAVKPGLTGLWQVAGRSNVSYPERANLDIEYIMRWSIWLDVKILLLTVPKLFNGAH